MALKYYAMTLLHYSMFNTVPFTIKEETGTISCPPESACLDDEIEVEIYAGRRTRSIGRTLPGEQVLLKMTVNRILNVCVTAKYAKTQ